MSVEASLFLLSSSRSFMRYSFSSLFISVLFLLYGTHSINGKSWMLLAEVHSVSFGIILVVLLKDKYGKAYAKNFRR